MDTAIIYIAASGPSKIWIHNSTLSQEGRALIAWTEVAETDFGHDTIEIGVPISDPGQVLTPGGREKMAGEAQSVTLVFMTHC